MRALLLVVGLLLASLASCGAWIVYEADRTQHELTHTEGLEGRRV